MRIKIGILVVYAVILSGICTPHIVAHELIKDISGTHAAILHFTPEDDPVAGAKTGIYYDIQGKEVVRQVANSLKVESDTGGIVVDLPLQQAGTSLSSEFTFPTRGAYILTLSIKNADGTVITFKSTLRIEHSLNGQTTSSKVPTWAVSGLFTTLLFLGILIAVAVWVKYKS